MFRLWAKLWKDNRILKELEIENGLPDTRTHKIFDALKQAVREFDITSPIWLDNNVRDFKEFSSVRFTQDSFIEEIEFDYLEIEILEEDSGNYE